MLEKSNSQQKERQRAHLNIDVNLLVVRTPSFRLKRGHVQVH